MADGSKIEWTDATWNPITGCSVVSPGCTNCYAMRLAGTRMKHHPSRAGLTQAGKAGPVWNGQVRLNEGWLTQPLQWSRPRMVFVCAHGDLFHESVPDAWIDRVFAVMALCPQHKFQVLTKRAERMRDYAEVMERCYHADSDEWNRRWGDAAVDATNSPCGGAIEEIGFPLPGVWLGVSAEDQTRADERIPLLLQTPAAVRFVSLEPLLGAIQLTYGKRGVLMRNHTVREADENDRHPQLDWVIVGGESGPKARPMHPAWARSLRDQCVAAGVPFFFKQWGEFALRWPGDRSEGQKLLERVGKKAAGRLLDGIEHNGFPA